MQRTLVALGVCIATLAASAAGPIPRSSAQTAGLPEGNWIGYLGLHHPDYTFETRTSEVFADYQALGNFEASSVAGTVSGRWLIDVEGVASFDGQAAEANGVGVGVLSGPVDVIALELKTLTVTEPTIGMTITFTADELPTPGAGTLIVRESDCNGASGDWSIEFPSYALEGQFSATRAGSEATEESVATARRTSQEQLSRRGLAILANIRDGIIDPPAIRDLFSDAEGALSNRGEGACDGADSGRFRTATTQLVASMLFELAGFAGDLDADSMIETVLAGFRSGTFNIDREARDFWLGEYNRMVDAALTSADRSLLAKFSAASRSLGFDDQADTIDSLLADLGS